MTQEQAIERLKNKLVNDKEYLEQCNPFSDLVNEVRLDNKSIETILSMLEEKDKQIEEYRKIGLRTHKQQVQIKKSLKGIINKQNKIIDLMAEYISNITDCPFESEKTYLDCERMCDVRTDKEC